MSKQTKTQEEFVERKFEEVEGGYYDDYDFYYTPNGSNRYILN